jgi:hypothetical protein
MKSSSTMFHGVWLGSREVACFQQPGISAPTVARLDSFSGWNRRRRRRRNYRDSHINHVRADGLEKLPTEQEFIIVDRRVYPMVRAPIRDFGLKFSRSAENISASRP